MFRHVVRLLLLLAVTACAPDSEAAADAGTVHVAVAANFADVQGALAAVFTEGMGHRIVASVGSTGQLYAQIRNGAPFDVFLAADAERPALLERDGLAVAGSRFTYALGRLVLYGESLDSVQAGGRDLLDPRVRNVALALARTAPYGTAAEEVLRRLGHDSVLASKLVRGENIAQTFHFVESGAAELGFVAFSQVIRKHPHQYWLIPEELHTPIRQDAVLLVRGEGKAAARQYLAFLQSEAARSRIEAFGYGVP